ncbi:MAG: hypothetical protein H6825_03565 [Planctomycetes bacterium]|nr:hypothetical protein [Planctomycetota bacterium]
MSKYAISIFLREVKPFAADQPAFDALSAKKKDDIRTGWIDLRNAILPASEAEGWHNLLVGDCCGLDECMALACGVVAECVRKHEKRIRAMMLPMPRSGVSDSGHHLVGGVEGDWVPCGRNCHGGAFALGYAASELSVPPLALTFVLDETPWRGLVSFEVDVAELCPRQ